MRPLSQHARSPPRPCCANLKPANPVERTPCLRLTLSPRGTSTACAPCSKRTRALSRSRKNSTSISWRCKRPSCKKARSILACPAITKPGATPSVKAIRALRSLAARNRCACCTPTHCYPTPARTRRPYSSPKPQPRAASARWSSTSSGLWMSTLPTRKTNSPASTCAWPGTMLTAAF